jgi:hypothetical protein
LWRWFAIDIIIARYPALSGPPSLGATLLHAGNSLTVFCGLPECGTRPIFRSRARQPFQACSHIKLLILLHCQRGNQIRVLGLLHGTFNISRALRTPLRNPLFAFLLPAPQHLQVPRLGRKQLLRLPNQAGRMLFLDLGLRYEGGFLRFYDAGAAFGKVGGPGCVSVGGVVRRDARKAHFFAVGFVDFFTAPWAIGEAFGGLWVVGRSALEVGAGTKSSRTTSGHGGLG